MIGSKSAHLVERAAERLLRAGVLEDSAAQLLEPGRDRGTADDTLRPPVVTTAGLSAPTSSLTDPHSGDMLVAESPGRDVSEPREDIQRPERPVVSLATLERAGLFDWTRGRSR